MSLSGDFIVEIDLTSHTFLSQDCLQVSKDVCCQVGSISLGFCRWRFLSLYVGSLCTASPSLNLFFNVSNWAIHKVITTAEAGVRTVHTSLSIGETCVSRSGGGGGRGGGGRLLVWHQTASIRGVWTPVCVCVCVCWCVDKDRSASCSPDVDLTSLLAIPVLSKPLPRDRERTDSTH